MREAIRSCLIRVAGDRAGNFMLEFALSLPVLSLMLVGMLDLGRYALQQSSITEGARQGAQYGILAYTDTANINTTARNATGLSGVTATNAVFCECVAGTTVSCSSTCGTGTFKRYITVTTSKAFSSVLSSGTLSFGSFGSWTAPTSTSASITMIVP